MGRSTNRGRIGTQRAPAKSTVIDCSHLILSFSPNRLRIISHCAETSLSLLPHSLPLPPSLSLSFSPSPSLPLLPSLSLSLSLSLSFSLPPGDINWQSSFFVCSYIVINVWVVLQVCVRTSTGGGGDRQPEGERGVGEWKGYSTREARKQ